MVNLPIGQMKILRGLEKIKEFQESLFIDVKERGDMYCRFKKCLYY